MNVTVVGGAGYVGLITGLGLAELGHQVVCVDVDRERVERLAAGQPVLYEEGLEAFLRRQLESGRIRFTTDLRKAIGHRAFKREAIARSAGYRELLGSETTDVEQVIFIAVGTPARADGQADLADVIGVAEELADLLEGYTVIAVKSTVPVGTIELIRGILGRSRREGTDFDLVSNPEFLREGKGLYDFFYPDRIVIGASSPRARAVMRMLYTPLIERRVNPPLPGRLDPPREPVPVVETDIASAQMIKYAANAFLALRISFINEVAGICERVGADVREVVRGIGFDARIGHHYLEPGLGFGGPCLEKDLRALVHIAEANGYEPHLLRAALERNALQVHEIVAKVKRFTGYLIYRKVIAVFGLAFKAGTHDVRNSSALKLIDALEREGAIVQAHDPVAIPEALRVRPGLRSFEDPYEAVAHADVLVIATDWPQFRQLDWARIRERMASPCVVDGRNLLDPEALAAAGFRYLSVGRPVG